jgi:hypothetical protein
MYVNRAQCVVAFGVRDKDHAIAEFLPATWAYQMAGIQGFRTFCKIDDLFYEPFQKRLSLQSAESSRSLTIEPGGLQIREIHHVHSLQFDVRYFSVVNRPVAALVRVLKITNTQSDSISLSILDGMPLILPAGFTDYGIKRMRRIHEAYASVRLIDGVTAFFSSRVRVHDEAEVGEVEEGNFFAAWIENDGDLLPVEPVIDPDIVFGAGNDLITPRLFIENDMLERGSQVWENRLPCALAHFETVLEEGRSIRLVEMIGHSPHEAFVSRFVRGIQSWKDIQALDLENKDLVDSITLPGFTRSSRPEFDAYCRQNYLDNVLRGGIPEMFPSRDGERPVYLYERRHGDLERDYNDFVIPDEPLSSGPGNFRDILQNRRHDVWFNPELKDMEIRMFLSLIQADGYNPLAVEGYRWVFPASLPVKDFCPAVTETSLKSLSQILASPFTPGSLAAWAQQHEVPSNQIWPWVRRILERCETRLTASGHEGGYWIDHWTYLTDLLESFAAIWPDRVESMLSSGEDIGWFWEGAQVVSRAEKYHLRPQGPVQIHAVQDGPLVNQGLPPVTPFAKLCAICAVKALSFDSQGIGIEMEAGRPGWNDSLNGLPAHFGSSTCETAELARLARWLQAHLPHPPSTEFPVEVADFLEGAMTFLGKPKYDWSEAATLREVFRNQVYRRTSGAKKAIAGETLLAFLQEVERRALEALEAATDRGKGLIHTCYIGEPTKYSIQGDASTSQLESASHRVDITEFQHESLPLFLEGQVHLMRLLGGASKARQVYRSVRQSRLFDEEIRMYKLNESLGDWPPTIGRARTFTRGWFENESIWPHMSYKYLLEVLRAGLAEEFFEDAETMLIPFLEPSVYGRSILENSSFIASSVCPDPNARGRGFVARLSGATAEFIHIWLMLTVGERPFSVCNGLLKFSLAPTLPGSWFSHTAAAIPWKGREVLVPQDSFACAFLGKILLVYVNPLRRNTYGLGAVCPVCISIDGGPKVEFSHLSAHDAERIRSRECDSLFVWLGEESCQTGSTVA